MTAIEVGCPGGSASCAGVAISGNAGGVALAGAAEGVTFVGAALGDAVGTALGVCALAVPLADQTTRFKMKNAQIVTNSFGIMLFLRSLGSRVPAELLLQLLCKSTADYGKRFGRQRVFGLRREGDGNSRTIRIGKSVRPVGVPRVLCLAEN